MQNLEAKFRLANLKQARTRAEAIGFVFSATLIQRDTFFAVSLGKLKLREENGAAALIHYQRDTSHGFELSNYSIATITDPTTTRTILASALGVIAEVRKRRTLLLRENIRLHLDEVQELGQFGEIEVVLQANHHSDAAHAAMHESLEALEVQTRDRIDLSYFELMGRKPPDRPMR